MKNTRRRFRKHNSKNKKLTKSKKIKSMYNKTKKNKVYKKNKRGGGQGFSRAGYGYWDEANEMKALRYYASIPLVQRQLAWHFEQTTKDIGERKAFDILLANSNLYKNIDDLLKEIGVQEEWDKQRQITARHNSRRTTSNRSSSYSAANRQ